MAGEDASRFVEPAIRWAQDRLGSPDYPLRCLAFVEDAFERSNQIEMFGGSSAAESAELYGVVEVGSEPPPRGALVFYRCAGPIGGEVREWGHVGLSLGDGSVVHAWDTVRVDPIAEIERLMPADGWTQPRLLGWTPPDRFLQGWRSRAWGDA